MNNDQFRSEFGLIDPIRYIIRDGVRVVAFPTRALAVSTWLNLNDFLVTYIRSVFGIKWYDEQLHRPTAEQLPVTRWHAHLRELERKVPKNESGLREVALDGPLRCLISLAYDLFLIEHHQSFSPDLIQRLRDPGTFQSARHEASVAAIMIRAGFRLEWEDESDNSHKHPEFIATELATGLTVAVEAKSIHRAGVFGNKQGHAPPTLDDVCPRKQAERVCTMVQQALPKSKGLPFLIFVDLNLEANVAYKVATEWGPHFHDILPQVDTGYDPCGVKEGFIHNLLMVTNFAAQYDAPGIPTEEPDAFLHAPYQVHCRNPIPDETIARVEHGVRTYGAIPVWYPGLFDKSTTR